MSSQTDNREFENSFGRLAQAAVSSQTDDREFENSFGRLARTAVSSQTDNRALVKESRELACLDSIPIFSQCCCRRRRRRGKRIEKPATTLPYA